MNKSLDWFKMASLPILTSLEIALSEEVVRDLFTSGKTFKQNLSGARAQGPVDMAGDRVSEQSSDKLLDVELEKVSETVIKLFIRGKASFWIRPPHYWVINFMIHSKFTSALRNEAQPVLGVCT